MRKEQGDLGQTSDQILGNNNIRNGPFDVMFHARAAARNTGTLACLHIDSHSHSNEGTGRGAPGNNGRINLTPAFHRLRCNAPLSALGIIAS